MIQAQTRTLGCERKTVRGKVFKSVLNDSVLELQGEPDNSMDMWLTSIPFGNQYEYSPSLNDMGHNYSNKEFFEQMDFLIPEMLRVLRPGRIAAVHVKDRIRFGNVTGDGFPIVDRFSDKTADAFEKHGFRTMGRITIDTDVVRENSQTYRLGWSENSKDGTKMGVGMPEYVLVFRKLPSDQSKGYADVPVSKLKGVEGVCQNCRQMIDEPEKNQVLIEICPSCGGNVIETGSDVEFGQSCYTRADWQIDAAGLWRSDGNRLPDPEVMLHMTHENIKALWERYSLMGGYSHEEHVALAKALEGIGKLPSSFMLFPPISRKADIWTDIARMRTLNTEQSRRSEEKHVCPLQLDIIKRLITRYTNKGECVGDPFAGIHSVGYQAIMMGRHAWQCELNPEYWRIGARYCEQAEREHAAPTLFDLAEMEAIAA